MSDDGSIRFSIDRTMRIKLPILIVLLLFLGSPTWSGPACGAGPSDAFFEADACARDVRKSPQKQKSRASWVQCIDRFQAVYRQDPRGPWAPASLFNSGTLYADLARTAGGDADRKAAVEQFELLQKRFPDSGYRDRAGAELQRLTAASPPRDERPAPQISRGAPVAAKPEPERKTAGKKAPAPAPAAGARDPLAKGDLCYRKLQTTPATEATRREWMLCIGRFHNAYLEDPSGPAAAQALYLEGMLYLALHKALKFDSDLRFARENFEKIAREYPGNEYAAKAARELQAMPRTRVEAAVAARRRARARPADLPARRRRGPPPAGAVEAAGRRRAGRRRARGRPGPQVLVQPGLLARRGLPGPGRGLHPQHAQARPGPGQASAPHASTWPAPPSAAARSGPSPSTTICSAPRAPRATRSTRCAWSWTSSPSRPTRSSR